ncbi:MAG: magnesium-dependent phosphatase-1 [Thermoprotei archaeon]
MVIKLVFIDLDLTIWDHWDASRLKPPFRRVSRDCIVDSTGESLCLYPCVREFLGELRKRGILVSSLSWNNPVIVLEILKVLSLNRYFDFHGIEYTPEKHLVARKVLEEVSARTNEVIKPCEIVLIDDNEKHYQQLLHSIGEIKYIKPGKDYSSLCELLHRIDDVFV